MIKWTEVLSKDTATLQAIAQELRVNPLAIEDCIHRDQRPKLDEYEHHQFLVWFMLAKGEVYELQFIIFPDQIIFVPHELPPDGSSWQEYLRLGNNCKDVWHLLYQAIDRATDITWEELRKVYAGIDAVEMDMFKKEVSPQSLLLVKNQLNQIDFNLGLLGSVAYQLQNLCMPKDDLKWKLRDLVDHCKRITQSIELYRAQIGTTIELYWGLQANKTNRQVKKLSLLASVSVPLTIWTSFWGMNFEVIPFDKPTLFYEALGVMALTVGAAVWLVIRRGYWD